MTTPYNCFDSSWEFQSVRDIINWIPYYWVQRRYRRRALGRSPEFLAERKTLHKREPLEIVIPDLRLGIIYAAGEIKGWAVAVSRPGQAELGICVIAQRTRKVPFLS
jgi:hypothetical protein